MIFNILARPFLKTLLEGSQTTIYCAVSEEMEGVSGKYLSDCQDQGIQTKATSEEDVERLWQLSCQWSGLKA
jgi:hypothetical protein